MEKVFLGYSKYTIPQWVSVSCWFHVTCDSHAECKSDSELSNNNLYSALNLALKCLLVGRKVNMWHYNIVLMTVQSNLVLLMVSECPRLSGSVGAPQGHSAPVLILATGILCSGPRPDALYLLCCGLAALWDLRINRANLPVTIIPMKSSVRFGRYST